jgi:hypothetical protein
MLRWNVCFASLSFFAGWGRQDRPRNRRKDYSRYNLHPSSTEYEFEIFALGKVADWLCDNVLDE